MHADRPPEETYGRVTNPNRFETVVDATRRLIERLSSEYRIATESSAGGFRVGSHDWGDADTETVHLIPIEGAPISVVFTSFPGVFIRFGEWGAEAFPTCGCDACDEDPDWVSERVGQLVEAVVAGRYEEELTRRSVRVSFSGPWGDSASETRLDPGEWKTYGQPGVHRWAEWPRHA